MLFSSFAGTPPSGTAIFFFAFFLGGTLPQSMISSYFTPPTTSAAKSAADKPHVPSATRLNDRGSSWNVMFQITHGLRTISKNDSESLIMIACI